MGKISLEDAKKAAETANSNHACISLLHTLACNSPHGEGECEFYDEDQLEDSWSLPSHQLWTDIYEAAMTAILGENASNYNKRELITSAVKLIREYEPDTILLAHMLTTLRAPSATDLPGL